MTPSPAACWSPGSAMRPRTRECLGQPDGWWRVLNWVVGRCVPRNWRRSVPAMSTWRSAGGNGLGWGSAPGCPPRCGRVRPVPGVRPGRGRQPEVPGPGQVADAGPGLRRRRHLSARGSARSSGMSPMTSRMRSSRTAVTGSPKNSRKPPRTWSLTSYAVACRQEVPAFEAERPAPAACTAAPGACGEPPEDRRRLHPVVTIATDDHHTLQEFRASVGAQWPFLSDPGRVVQQDRAGGGP